MPAPPSPQIVVHPDRFTIYRLDPNAKLPAWALEGAFWSVTRTPSELSIVAIEDPGQSAPARASGWRALSLVGPLDFALVGVLARLTRVLADAEVSVFAVSTYDTDWVLVQDASLADAVTALAAAGYHVSQDLAQET